MPRASSAIVAAAAALAVIVFGGGSVLADDADMTVRSIVDTEDPLKDRFAEGWIEEVRRAPARFIPRLLAYVDLKAASTAADWEVSRLAANAGAVLVNVCGEDGRAALARRVAELHAERDRLREQVASEPAEGGADKGRLRKMEYRLRHLEEALVDVFARAKDVRLRDAVLARLEKRDIEAVAVYLEYLDATCRGDADAKARLKPLVEGADAPLRDNAKLKAFLKSAPDKRK
jgi:hypothetical protein